MTKDESLKETGKFDSNNERIQYFQIIHGEIGLRIKNHSQLLLQKIASTGAILAFIIHKLIGVSSNSLFDENSYFIFFPIIGLWILPSISLIYDLMISKNISNIHEVGGFIKHRFENEYYKNETLWEKFIGQQEKYMDSDKYKTHIDSFEGKRIYDPNYKSIKEFRCYNKLDLKILWYYAIGLFLIDVFINYIHSM
jgi:hypothetical protein